MCVSTSNHAGRSSQGKDGAGFTLTDEVDANAAFGGPGQRHGADVLGAVIAANDLGFATPFDDPVEGADDAFGRQ